QREHGRDLAARQSQPAQVRGHERHVDADALVIEEIEDFDQIGTSRTGGLLDTAAAVQEPGQPVAEVGQGASRVRRTLWPMPTPVTTSPSNVTSKSPDTNAEAEHPQESQLQ